MKLSSVGAASAVAALWAATGTKAADFKRFDGVHRVEKVEKRVQVTQHAVLVARKETQDACGTSMKLCPSSLSGGCCPDNYDCAKESCYATTRGPSTCGTKVGWYACAAVYGGGCCPDGLLCQTAGECLPPSGVSYTFACPSSHYLCPSSLSYGCCPDGMGCAVNQCYSTEATTVTTTATIKTTEDGEVRTITTKKTTVREPDIPTDLPEVGSGDEDDQKVLKYFPSSVPKEKESTSDDNDDNDNSGGGGGLTTGQLAGIVTGAVAFLVLVIVIAFIIIRHLNKVVAAVSDSKQTSSSRTRPAMKQFRPTDSEIDYLSVDPLMMSPQPQQKPVGSTPDVVSSTEETPSSFAGAYQAVSTANSRHASWDDGGHGGGYFDALPGQNARHSVQSGFAPSSQNRVSSESHGTYMHVRHWSNASEDSNGAEGNQNPNILATELEARSVVPELPGSPTTVGSTVDDQHRRSSGSNSISYVMAKPQVAHQRGRSNTADLGHDLGVVDEEIHGFHGPSDRMTGQTDPQRRDSWREGDDSRHSRSS